MTDFTEPSVLQGEGADQDRTGVSDVTATYTGTGGPSLQRGFVYVAVSESSLIRPRYFAAVLIVGLLLLQAVS